MRAVAVVDGRGAPVGHRLGLAGAAVRRRAATRCRRAGARAGVAHPRRGARALARASGRAACPSSTRRGGRRCATARWSPCAAAGPAPGSGSSPTPSGAAGLARRPDDHRRAGPAAAHARPRRRPPRQHPRRHADRLGQRPRRPRRARPGDAAAPRTRSRRSWFAEPPAPERHWADVHVHVQYLGFAADHLGAARVGEMIDDGRRRPRAVCGCTALSSAPRAGRSRRQTHRARGQAPRGGQHAPIRAPRSRHPADRARVRARGQRGVGAQGLAHRPVAVARLPRPLARLHLGAALGQHLVGDVELAACARARR